MEESREYKNLADKNKEVCLCFLEPKLKEYSYEYLYNLVDQLILFAYQNTGFDLTEAKQQNIDDTLPTFVKDLQREAGTITFAELEILFAKGWRNEYGKFTGLNNTTYWAWIWKWIFDEDRIRLRKIAENRVEVTDKPVLSAEQKEQIVIDCIVSAYNRRKEGASGVMIFTVVSYDYLKRIGAINVSPESQQRIGQIVKKELREEAIADKGNKTVEKALAAIRSTDIINASKRRALQEHFDSWIEMGNDMAQIIADCKKEKEEGE